MALVNNPVMGINLRQNKNSKNAGYGKYYPEVDLQKTLTIRGFAQHMIDHGSKYNRGDIENILSMVTECLPELVAQGIPVQLGELGIFRPTCEAKASVADIAAMEGLNPNEVVKAIHIRFIPNQTKLDNLAGPAFKDQCSLELRNIIDTEKVTVDGKTKSMTTLLPIATAVARLKSGDSVGSENGGSQNQGGQSSQNTPGNSETSEGYALTVSKMGSGSASVTINGSAVTSGSALNEDDEVEISITPAEGTTPSATLNGSSIELTESDGVYTGNFAMPAQTSTLVINTGSAAGDSSI